MILNAHLPTVCLVRLHLLFSVHRAALRTIAAKGATEEKSANSAARQMLGMKGAALETNIWKIRVQLTKPVTWIPLIWGTSSSHRH